MKAAAAIVLVVVLGVGIVAVREATISRHVRMPRTSTMEVVVDVEQRGGITPLDELAGALFDVCELEVATDAVGDPARDGHRFTFVVRPALDETDQRQLRGCLEDAVVDHVQAAVVSMRRLDR